jgi:hypothetical protein
MAKFDARLWGIRVRKVLVVSLVVPLPAGRSHQCALGSASSSLVLYQKADAYSAGQKVIAVSGDASRSPFLGQISGATGDRYDVANGQFTEQVTASDIRGKMVFVIPFIGTVFGWVGL